MDLQKKTLVVLITFLILAVALTGIFVSAILLTNYQTLEKEYMTNDLVQTVSLLTNNEKALSAIAATGARGTIPTILLPENGRITCRETLMRTCLPTCTSVFLSSPTRPEG
jgi:hypothetical protein